MRGSKSLVLLFYFLGKVETGVKTPSFLYQISAMDRRSLAKQRHGAPPFPMVLHVTSSKVLTLARWQSQHRWPLPVLRWILLSAAVRSRFPVPICWGRSPRSVGLKCHHRAR